jgi:hypothetical protein
MLVGLGFSRSRIENNIAVLSRQDVLPILKENFLVRQVGGLPRSWHLPDVFLLRIHRSQDTQKSSQQAYLYFLSVLWRQIYEPVYSFSTLQEAWGY